MSEENERIESSQRRLTWIPDAIMEDIRVGKRELLVYLALARYANKKGECYPCYQTIADVSRLSRKTAIEAVETLVELGWIIKTTRKMGDGNKFTSCLYHLRDEPSSGVAITPQTPSSGVTITPGGVTITPRGVAITPLSGVAITPEGRIIKDVKEGGRKEGQDAQKSNLADTTEEVRPSIHPDHFRVSEIRRLLMEQCKPINREFLNHRFGVANITEQLGKLADLPYTPEQIANSVTEWLRNDPKRGDVKFYIEREIFKDIDAVVAKKAKRCSVHTWQEFGDDGECVHCKIERRKTENEEAWKEEARQKEERRSYHRAHPEEWNAELVATMAKLVSSQNGFREVMKKPPLTPDEIEDVAAKEFDDEELERWKHLKGSEKIAIAV